MKKPRSSPSTVGSIRQRPERGVVENLNLPMDQFYSKLEGDSIDRNAQKAEQAVEFFIDDRRFHPRDHPVLTVMQGGDKSRTAHKAAADIAALPIIADLGDMQGVQIAFAERRGSAVEFAHNERTGGFGNGRLAETGDR